MHYRKIVDPVKRKSLDWWSYAKIGENLHLLKGIVKYMVKNN